MFSVLRPARGVRRGRKCVKPPRRGGAHARRCTRFLHIGSFVHRDRAGSNRFRFTGRVRRHKLPAGSNRLQAVPSFGGHSGHAATAVFRIVG